MNNLRGFIQAARDANMLEEVATLENNLRMLQQEFRRQKVPLSPSEKEDDTVAAVKKQVTDIANFGYSEFIKTLDHTNLSATLLHICVNV